jgi:hypothetical protein
MRAVRAIPDAAVKNVRRSIMSASLFEANIVTRNPSTRIPDPDPGPRIPDPDPGPRIPDPDSIIIE